MLGTKLTRRQALGAMAAAGLSAGLYPKVALSQDGKILKVRSYGDITGLDPAFRSGAPEDDVMRNIFPGLATMGPGTEWKWQLDSAVKLEQTDPTHIAFTLMDGLKWSDGEPVTADDVKYSFERFLDPKLEAVYKGDWEALDHVEVIDEKSGVIVLKEAFPPLWNVGLVYGSGRIIPRKATEAMGGRFENTPPAQCGRYFIKEWLPKQRLVLAKNPDWPGEPGAFEEIHIRPIDDEKTGELALESGDIDYTWLSVSSIPRYRQTPPKGGKIEVRPSLAYVWLGMNQEMKPFDQPEVRRAVQHAIDVPTVLEAAYFGAATPATGLIAPGLLGHRAKNIYGYDPDKAREFLAQAGLQGGFECTIDILNKAERIAAAQAVQANLAEVGINATIRQYDSGTFWTIGDEKAGDIWKTIGIQINRFSMQPDPSFATDWFTPEQIGIWNWERWNNPEYGELNKKAKVETDTAKRHDMYVKMQDLMEESGSYVFLTHEAVGIGYSDKIAPALMPNGTPIFYGFKPA
ncbi:peptide ABC transporter substrate-binding protein [Pseudaminobacter sp. 19-2017]|uniref:Peptide ABC transporter substrate-binding protein n=1 Tax=Pseudaminobacter soli (ex Zhang et al. 2022) TaxID=2831468 RepID=A0A942I482_9HYPH|nr:ABC transporter substrate-binding protein [Pseudaminobacter soli]MBS3651064.1 peptide ABC transporter substrate-binding protein [Pseudaminobacter soli]